MRKHNAAERQARRVGRMVAEGKPVHKVDSFGNRACDRVNSFYNMNFLHTNNWAEVTCHNCLAHNPVVARRNGTDIRLSQIEEDMPF